MINSIYNLGNIEFGKIGGELGGKSKGNIFAKVLEDSITKLNNYQKASEDVMTSFIKGNENEIHNVMIAMQEAKLSIQTAIEIRNKLVDAYQEIARIQI